MTEVPEVGEPQRHVAPGEEHGAGIEAWRGTRLGPTPARPIAAAAASALSDDAATVGRQSKPPKALNRCGAADPSVSAPTRIPTMSPMSPFAQVATSFMPTG